MPTYNAPVRDMLFILRDLLRIESYAEISGFEEAAPDVVAAILAECARFAREVVQPLNQPGDREGCCFEGGAVATPRGYKEAYRQYVENGWGAFTGDPEYGGQGLPYALSVAVAEMMSSACTAFSMYPGLTHGAIDLLEAYGTDEQKRLYLPRLISGEWSGTMNLTEAHCGTDLGLLRTCAEAQPDGSYRLHGTKIFISSGEHDLTENIVHLVLARMPGAPPGVKGISLFLVPKFLLNDDGDPDARNGVVCGGIEEKMGIHGNATCVLHYDGAVGWLVGEANKGLRAMFTMMNAARLGVGVQGLSLAEAACQNAAAYARERLQGRALSGTKVPDKPADPIVVHPDVRRMLMTGRAFVEGARALGLWAGLQVDLAARHPDASVRRDSEDLLALLTPVIKAYFTDKGFEATNLALQVYGGHGYIRESGMEQFVRDARITQIYEGANGIQALDLVARKLPAEGGRAVRLFMDSVRRFCRENQTELPSLVEPLAVALDDLQRATRWLADNAPRNPDRAGAASMDYLHLMALVAIGWQWARMAAAAQDKLARGEGDAIFLSNKLITARFFVERMLPDTRAHLAKIEAGADSLMALTAEAF